MPQFSVNGIQFNLQATFNPTNCFGASPAPWCLKDNATQIVSVPDALGNIPVQANKSYSTVTLQAPVPSVICSTTFVGGPQPKVTTATVPKVIAPVVAAPTTTAAAASSPVSKRALKKAEVPVQVPVPVAVVPVPTPVVAKQSPVLKPASPVVTPAVVVPQVDKAATRAAKKAEKAARKTEAKKVVTTTAPAAAYKPASSDSEDEPLSMLMTQHATSSSEPAKGGKRSRSSASPVVAFTPPTPLLTQQAASESDASAKKKTRAEKSAEKKSASPQAPPQVALAKTDSNAPILALAPARNKAKSVQKSPIQVAAPVPTPRASTLSQQTPRPVKPHPKRPADDSSTDDE